jgi:hypothetical protein
MRRIAGGIAGWLAAIVSLLGVNLAGYAGAIDSGTAVIAGAAALFGGVLLGGVVTGVLGGRRSATYPGGATSALLASAVAAALYIISLVSIVVLASRFGAAPEVVATHPLRITGAIIFLGAILLGLSLLVAMLAGKSGGAATKDIRPAGMQYPDQQRQSARGNHERGAHENAGRQARPRTYDDQGPRDDWEYAPRYESRQGDRRDYDDRQQASHRGAQPARPPSPSQYQPDPPRQGRVRDDGWHADGR